MKELQTNSSAITTGLRIKEYVIYKELYFTM